MRMLPPEIAVTTFDEVLLGYSQEEAIAEARRAEDADLSSASAACPFGVDVNSLVRRIQDGDFDGAWQRTQEAFRALLPLLSERGVTFCQESLPGPECDFINVAAEAARDHALERDLAAR